MRLTNKKFPHPVLLNGNDDYKKSKFSTEVKIEIEGSNLIFSIDSILKNIEIESLIAEKKADFFLHMESNETRYREYQLFNGDKSYTNSFPCENFGKNIEVLVGIVTLEDISNFRNNDLNDDFNGLDISLMKGDILALDTEKKIRIEKEDFNDNIGSIFIICPNDDIEVPTYDVQEDEDKITIFMPRVMVKKYSELESNPDSHSILNSIFIIPVLSEVMRILKEEPNKYEECDWAIVVNDKLKKLDISLESIENYYEVANKIFNTLAESSLDVLKELLEK